MKAFPRACHSVVPPGEFDDGREESADNADVPKRRADGRIEMQVRRLGRPNTTDRFHCIHEPEVPELLFRKQSNQSDDNLSAAHGHLMNVVSVRWCRRPPRFTNHDELAEKLHKPVVAANWFALDCRSATPS